ncbi:MAG: hypothetical protein R2711_16350 [Acidimicrobiales bacterium]
MPIDRSTQPTAGTTRRTFLARTAGIGALVTAGAVVAPTLGAAPWAGAQAGDSELTGAAFASFATPYELAAVQAYLLALRSGQLDATWTDRARQFQMNHQATADTLTTLLGDEDPAPGPMPTWSSSSPAPSAVPAARRPCSACWPASRRRSPPPTSRPYPCCATPSPAAPWPRSWPPSRSRPPCSASTAATFEELTPAEASDEGGIPLSDAPDAGDSTGETTTTAAN